VGTLFPGGPGAVDPPRPPVRLGTIIFQRGRNARRVRCVQQVMDACHVRAVPLFLLLVAVGAVACGAKTSPGASGTGSSHPRPAATAPASLRISRAATITFSALPTPAPRPSGTRTPGGQVTLTAADNGASIAVRIGQLITVDLGGRGVMSYHQPHASGTTLERLWASGGYPARRGAMAGFRAVRTGTSNLVSITDARCLHVSPRCAFPQISWRVTVIVH
jgi:hypothetical protein